MDRSYVFTDLGDFADMPNTRYILTSNEDRHTPNGTVMWTLDLRVPATVFLNFRSMRHVRQADSWLTVHGWERSKVKGTVSTGIPNGPYCGPVFFKEVEAGQTDLYGSFCYEGTYFVFVQFYHEV